MNKVCECDCKCKREALPPPLSIPPPKEQVELWRELFPEALKDADYTLPKSCPEYAQGVLVFPSLDVVGTSQYNALEKLSEINNRTTRNMSIIPIFGSSWSWGLGSNKEFNSLYEDKNTKLIALPFQIGNQLSGKCLHCSKQYGEQGMDWLMTACMAMVLDKLPEGYEWLMMNGADLIKWHTEKDKKDENYTPFANVKPNRITFGMTAQKKEELFQTVPKRFLVPTVFLPKR